MQSKKHPVRLKEPYIEVLQVAVKPKRKKYNKEEFRSLFDVKAYIRDIHPRRRRRWLRTVSAPNSKLTQTYEQTHMTCTKCGKSRYKSHFDHYRDDWHAKGKRRNYCFDCRRKENEEDYLNRKAKDTRTPSEKRKKRREAYLKAKAEGYYEKRKEMLKTVKEKYKI